MFKRFSITLVILVIASNLDAMQQSSKFSTTARALSRQYISENSILQRPFTVDGSQSSSVLFSKAFSRGSRIGHKSGAKKTAQFRNPLIMASTAAGLSSALYYSRNNESHNNANSDLDTIIKAKYPGFDSRDINKKNDSGKTILICAIEKDDIEAVQLLLKHKDLAINAPGEYGYTPLMVASQNGLKEIAQLLLDNRANVNNQDNNGSTALHHAVTIKDEQIVKILLDYGAGINIRNDHGNLL